MPTDHDAYVRAFRLVVRRLGCRHCRHVDELALEADSLICHGPLNISTDPETGACLSGRPRIPKGQIPAFRPPRRNTPPRGTLDRLRSNQHQ